MTADGESRRGRGALKRLGAAREGCVSGRDRARGGGGGPPMGRASRAESLGRRLCAALGVVPVELGRDGLDARVEIRLPASGAAGDSGAVAFSSRFTSFEDCWDDLLFGDWSLAYQAGVWRSKLKLLRRRGLAGGRLDEYRETCERKALDMPRFSSAEELELWLAAKGA